MDSEFLLQAQENDQERPVPEKQKADLLDILSDIRQYCEGEEQEMIDQALQMISMIELYQVCAETAS
ncbi:MAG: hypothetical protein LIP11_03645 [Clostridiales bacterium]|nr:hypothetical protein [Clostridiales bacterium]